MCAIMTRLEEEAPPNSVPAAVERETMQLSLDTLDVLHPFMKRVQYSPIKDLVRNTQTNDDVTIFKKSNRFPFRLPLQNLTPFNLKSLLGRSYLHQRSYIRRSSVARSTA
ncbi:hypothetical protein L1887_34373 [Cichorium endivia]|nr:hypothetical protein L1887_34373 [Cichorium endivia]